MILRIEFRPIFIGKLFECFHHDIFFRILCGILQNLVGRLQDEHKVHQIIVRVALEKSIISHDDLPTRIPVEVGGEGVQEDLPPTMIRQWIRASRDEVRIEEDVIPKWIDQLGTDHIDIGIRIPREREDWT